MIDISSIPISLARRAGDFLFLSGQVAFESNGKIEAAGIAAQTQRVLTNIEAVLAANGAALADVVNATAYLTNPDDFMAYNAAYREFFPQLPPARTTVITGLMLGALIEIAVVAYAPAQKN